MKRPSRGGSSRESCKHSLSYGHLASLLSYNGQPWNTTSFRTTSPTSTSQPISLMWKTDDTAEMPPQLRLPVRVPFEPCSEMSQGLGMLRQVPVAINKNKQVSREVNKFCWNGAKKNSLRKSEHLWEGTGWAGGGGGISFSNIEYCYQIRPHTK